MLKQIITDTANCFRATLNGMSKTRQRRGPGRPPQPAATRQSKAIKVNFTPSEWRGISESAALTQVSLSAYVRAKVLAV